MTELCCGTELFLFKLENYLNEIDSYCYENKYQYNLYKIALFIIIKPVCETAPRHLSYSFKKKLIGNPVVFVFGNVTGLCGTGYFCDLNDVII